MKNRKFILSYFHLFIIILLIIGIFLRFINLDAKVYWRDETSTSLRLSGYTPTEVRQALEGRIVSPQDILKYQKPNSEKGIIDTIKASAYNATHPPLYFLMARFWGHWFGSSPAIIRSLSASISLLAFPSIYWLCLELFNSSRVGWMAMALIAVSPFHVIYAQEARMYSLWTVEISLLSVFLLRAMRLNTKTSWIFYGLTLAISLYTYLFNVFVSIGHGIYIFLIEGFRFSKKLISYIIACFIAIVIFMPWILVVLANRDSFATASNWINSSYALKNYLSIMIQNLVSIFMDFWYFRVWYPDWNIPHIPWARFFIPFTIILVGYSLYFLCRNTSKRVWLFIFSLCGITICTTILPDLVFGGIRGIIARYFTPLYLGIELSVAYLLVKKIDIISSPSWQQKFWRFTTIILLTSGLVSCWVNSAAPGSWYKWEPGREIPPIARTINQVDTPIIIVATPLHRFLPLTHQLKPKVRILLGREPDVTDITEMTNNFDAVFLLQNNSESFKNLKEQVKQETELEIKTIFDGQDLSLTSIR
ncbi:MAG: glycosyltransferase family 39 protein [Xenococcaceae cyanobacterium MO_207.B15]|nr:glycosyltransferase family 39 protein [Xenococcaceae cyanobacterium MO_207.B15]